MSAMSFLIDVFLVNQAVRKFDALFQIRVMTARCQRL